MNDDDIHAWKASAERAEQECRDRDAVEQDLRGCLADAEKALARVRELAVWWQDEADKSIEGGFEQWASIQASVGDGILAAIAGHHLRAALDGKP